MSFGSSADRVAIPGSNRAPLPGANKMGLGPADPGERIGVTVHLQPSRPLDKVVADLLSPGVQPGRRLSRDEFAAGAMSGATPVANPSLREDDYGAVGGRRRPLHFRVWKLKEAGVLRDDRRAGHERPHCDAATGSSTAPAAYRRPARPADRRRDPPADRGSGNPSALLLTAHSDYDASRNISSLVCNRPATARAHYAPRTRTPEPGP
jgi:hypothetical protein